MKKKLFAGLLLSAALASGLAAGLEPSDLKWDLSYRSALREHPIGEREFMRIWPGRYPSRPIHEKLAAYVGEPVEASLLIEQPDGHTGDPSATWFIKTHDAAQACSFHPSSKDQPCTELDPVKVERFIRDVMRFKPLPDQASERNAIGGGEPGKPILLNYMGFLSVFVDGKAQQRPIALSEWAGAGNREQAASADAGRLANAIARVMLSDADFARHQEKQDAQARQLDFEDAIRRGDVRQMERMLEQAPERGAALMPPGLALVALAAGNGQQEAAAWLLRHGAAVDAEQNAALKAAVKANDGAMVDFLLAMGAKLDTPKGGEDGNTHYDRSVLAVAVESGNETMVALLLRRGADPNYMDDNCVTAYGLALHAHLEGMQRLLAERGADVNASRRCKDIERNGQTGSREGAEGKARAAIAQETRRHLGGGDFAALEKLHARLNSDKVRTPSGVWGLAVFYGELKKYPSRTLDPAYWAREAARAAEWEHKFPNSAAASMYRFYLLYNRALALRGNGNYADIRPENLEPMTLAVREANQLLDRMDKTSSRKNPAVDANWYRAKVELLPYSELFYSHFPYAWQGGALVYPDYHEMYFAAAVYSLPEWSGAPDGVEQVARRAAKGKGSDRDAMYARVYWYLDQVYYQGKVFENSMADWDDMKTSFDALVKAYPDPWNLNAYAYFACMAGDYSTMSSVLRRIDDQLVFSSWGRNGAYTYHRCARDIGADSSHFAADLAARNKRLREAHYYRLIQYGIRKRDEFQNEESLRALEAAKEAAQKVWGRSGMMTYYNIAQTLHKLARYEEELQALKLGLQSQPGYMGALFQMGLAYEKLGRKDEARAQFAASVAHTPQGLDGLDQARREAVEKERVLMRAKLREYGIDAAGF